MSVLLGINSLSVYAEYKPPSTKRKTYGLLWLNTSFLARFFKNDCHLLPFDGISRMDGPSALGHRLLFSVFIYRLYDLTAVAKRD